MCVGVKLESEALLNTVTPDATVPVVWELRHRS